MFQIGRDWRMGSLFILFKKPTVLKQRVDFYHHNYHPTDQFLSNQTAQAKRKQCELIQIWNHCIHIERHYESEWFQEQQCGYVQTFSGTQHAWRHQTITWVNID